MYGTIAKMKLKPGMEQAFKEFGERASTPGATPGLVFDYVFKLDSGNNEYFLVAGFTDKEAYTKNANSPEQHKRYEEYRALLAEDPEWHDGEIVFASK
jgi:quinol monooxygenase YgiN